MAFPSFQIPLQFGFDQVVLFLYDLQQMKTSTADTAAEAMRTHVMTSLRRTMIRLNRYFALADMHERGFVRSRKTQTL